MSESKVWAGLNEGQRNDAVLGVIVEGKSPLSPGSYKELTLTMLEVIEHMATPGFAAFMAVWQPRLQAAALVYAGSMQYVQTLLTAPEVGGKATIGPKDGIKLFGEVAKEQPISDPASDVSDQTVQRAAEIVKNNAWKVSDSDTSIAQEN